MPTLNEVKLMGHLSRDPELRYTPNGSAVTNFTVATNWGSGDRRETEWHNCVVWNSKVIPWAEQTAKLHKGDLVYVSGRLKTRSWEQDGVKRSKTEIAADRVDFLRAAGQKTNSDDDSTFPGLVEARRAANEDNEEPPF